MKKQLIKNLSFLFLLLLVFNCSSKTENGSKNLALTALVVGSDSTSSDETAKVVTSKSNYTLSQDLSSKSDVKPEKTKRTVSLTKLGDKYVSDRILLEDLDIGTKFEISSNLGLEFEVYLGISALAKKEDKQERFQDLSSTEGSFRITKTEKKYTVEIFQKVSYSLFLVSASKQEVTIKLLSSESKKSQNTVNTPTEVVSVTEKEKEVSFKFRREGKFWNSYRSPQLAYSVDKGDRIYTSWTVKPDKRYLAIGSPYYTGTSLFKNEADMDKRVIQCCSDWPATFSFTFPGDYFHKKGDYSSMDYIYTEGELGETVKYKIIKVKPYVPENSATIISIDDSFKSIEYIEDTRNTVLKAYTSNQFTLTGVQDGTILITQFHSTKDWDNLENSDLARMTFYKGTDRLTDANIRTRYIPIYKVVDSFKSKKERIYLARPGDYTIVFTNYSDEKKTDHKVKVEK